MMMQSLDLLINGSDDEELKFEFKWSGFGNSFKNTWEVIKNEAKAAGDGFMVSVNSIKEIAVDLYNAHAQRGAKSTESVYGFFNNMTFGL